MCRTASHVQRQLRLDRRASAARRSGDIKDESEAGRVVNEALDAGINFFDNAWEYHDGLSEERLGRAATRQTRPVRS